MRQILTALILFFSILSSKGIELNTGWLFTAPDAVAADYTSFCQGPGGFLWVGTDRGLLRFDGNTFDIYSSNSSRPGSLSDNRVLDLLCDSKGRIWVATANGLNLYDSKTDSFRVLSLPSLNFYGYIIDIDEMSNGTVIFIVAGIGLYIIGEEAEEPVAVRYMSILDEEKNFNSIISSPSGKLYAGTRNGEVCVIEANGRASLVKVCDNYIKDILLDADGNVLVADVSRIFRINVTDSNKLTELSSTGPVQITRLSLSPEGTVYVGTAGSGLWHISPGSDMIVPSTEIYSPFLNLRTAHIGAVYLSPDGNLWLGCNYHGVVMIPATPLPFTYSKFTDLYPDFAGGVNAVASWKGNALVALDKGRLVMLSPEGKPVMNVTIPDSGALNSLTVTDDDKVIVGVADNGLWEVSLPDGRVSHILRVDSKFPNISVAPGFGDDLFVAVHGYGVIRFNKKTGSRSVLPVDGNGDRLTNSYITDMCRTSDDKIWMGLFGGIACYDLKGDSLMSIDQEPFRSGASYTVEELGDGKVVVGTSQGLVLYDTRKNEIRRFTREDGLVENDVRDIAIDDKGRLWIGTLRGLSCFNPEDGKIVSFHGGYGLVENVVSHIESTADGKKMFMTGNLGLTSFSPEVAMSQGFNSKVKISGIYLNGQRLSPGTIIDGREFMEGDPESPEALFLPYKENAITLRVTTSDFRDGSNINYRWRLIGLSNEWTVTRPGDALIYLPHLDPGKYKLQIQAMENGVLSAPDEITINISTPWYLRWWAKVLYWLVGICILVLALQLFIKKRQAQENESRIKFFMDVSHDIRSPITLIMSPLEQLMKEPFDKDVKMKLKTMYRNSQRILSLVNQLLELRKLEKGKMRLSCRLTDMNKFVSELVDMFKPQAQEKGVTLEFEADDNLPEIWVDRTNFDKILVNLISNAIKFTPEGGMITVRNSMAANSESGLYANPESAKFMEVSVTDTGIGLDSKTEHSLFDRFYQGDGKDNSGKGGFGIGLDLCRRLVEFHHGYITGRNRNDGVRGSVFTVAIPISPSAYSAEELKGETTVEEDVVTRGYVMPVTQENTERRERQTKQGGLKTLMVIDDDSELREYICGQFSRHYKVVGVQDGAEALRLIGDSKPDVIISDVMMPGLDGLSLLRRLKGNADTHHIPVVLLSSKQDIADRMAGWERGADGYIGKPFHIEELEAMVETLIENRQRLKGKFSGAQDTEGKIAPPEMKGNDELLMERVMKIIDRYIDDPKLNVEKLSQEAGLSRAHLHRKMKDMVGMTPSDFIRTIRMRRACELLQKGDVAVTLVAYKVGFTSQPHFSTMFKNFTGFTPSEYRARVDSGDEPVRQDA